MKLSVIIVSWNAKAFLMDCLRSIRMQRTEDEVEIIVVDNASSDGSPEAVRGSFPGVKLICNTGNCGFAKANNIGIEASTGEYLFLINSDVVVHEGCFGAMTAWMKAHPQIGVLGPRIMGADGKIQRSCMGYPSLWNTLSRAFALDTLFPRLRLFGGQLLTYWGHDETKPVEVINGCFWLVRRSAIEEVGLLDEDFFIYGEDVDWCRRFHEHGWKVVFFREATATHYGGASSANAPVRFYLEGQRARYTYWRKHSSRTAAGVFLLITLLHHAVRLAGGAAAYALRPARRQDAKFKMTRAAAAIKWVLGAMGGEAAHGRRSMKGREVCS